MLVKSNEVVHEHYGLTLYVVNAGQKYLPAPSGSATIAEIGKDIVFDPYVLDTYHYDGWKPVHHDLLLIAAAVEYADRSTARRASHWARDFNVTVPVVELATWQQPEVQANLRAALRHLTADNWQFSFTEWQGESVLNERQRSLVFDMERSFVIAYSDGLDSHCVSKLVDGEGVCVRVTKHHRALRASDQPFDQIPFRVNVRSARESSVRSRGFKFAAITAIAAHLTGLKKIVVPESGQGALGPVLLPLHNIYPDYRNHPTYFRKMERFIRTVLGHDVHYEQPRLWYTKGQTVSAFTLASNKAAEELSGTRSCWQQRWNAKVHGELRQCGLCAACLLRRMSMHTAGIKEPDYTYAIADLTVSTFSEARPSDEEVRLSDTMVEYGSVGARHFQQLADLAYQPDEDLRVHAFEIAGAMGEPQEEVLMKLRNMLLTHAEEWRAFMAAQGEQSFLWNWIKGGRHGRPE